MKIVDDGCIVLTDLSGGMLSAASGLAGLGRRPLAPGHARGRRGVQCRRDDLVLVLDLLGHRGCETRHCSIRPAVFQ
jgi:hypothetical protein